MNVLDQIREERGRQDAKFGEQNHGDEIWLLILAEEVGEIAKEIIEARSGRSGIHRIKSELVQAAAVCVAWLQAIERRCE